MQCAFGAASAVDFTLYASLSRPARIRIQCSPFRLASNANSPPDGASPLPPNAHCACPPLPRGRLLSMLPGTKASDGPHPPTAPHETSSTFIPSFILSCESYHYRSGFSSRGMLPSGAGRARYNIQVYAERDGRATRRCPRFGFEIPDAVGERAFFSIRLSPAMIERERTP